MKTDFAVSEIVGALILVALVITGIGIIGVIMLSTPPPEAQEKLVLSSSCMQCDPDSFVIVNRHEGGDPIVPSKFDFFLTTEYKNHTTAEYKRVYPTSFFPANVTSEMDKTDLCNETIANEHSILNNSQVMKNGDVIVIWYEMKETN